jgi:hypothetical protein
MLPVHMPVVQIVHVVLACMAAVAGVPDGVCRPPDFEGRYNFDQADRDQALSR